jgi:acyl-CoA synthetase (AMP-forming)/AMP-acid ligase II
MNLGLSLERNATRVGKKTAVICEGRTYTYDELNRIVNRLAHGLLTRGVKKGDRIALMMKNSDHFVIVFYAIMKVGAIAVPINFRLTTPEVRYILGDSESSVVFFDDIYAKTIKEAAEELPHDILQVSIGAEAEEGQIRWEEFVSNNDANPNVNVLESDDCEILYTSGTTGKPKGALFDHHRIFHVGVNVMAMMSIHPNDRMLHLAPLFHCAQLNLFMVLGTFLGCTQVIHRDFHPIETLRAIEEHKITLFFGVPTMYNFLLQVPNAKDYDLSSVKRCGYGAAPMPISLLKKSMELFEHDQFYNLCGLTEGGPGGICLTPDRHVDKIGSGGLPIPNTEARVVDDEGNDVPPGVVGEFIIRGETIMKEYYKKPEETKKALRDGWLYTGDLATIDEDGFITLVDRKKDMIISGGENVYSTEVEHVLYSHPQVLEAAVIGVPHEVWGEAVAAVIVPKPGQTIDFQELQEFCRKSLAGYKIPRVFYEAEQLPRNASGKVLKYQLRKQYQTLVKGEETVK